MICRLLYAIKYIKETPTIVAVFTGSSEFILPVLFAFILNALDIKVGLMK